MKLQLFALSLLSLLCQQVSSRKSEELLNELANTSNHAIRRMLNKTVVNVNIYFREIEFIDIDKMEIKVQVTVRHQWFDLRLNFSSDKPYVVLHPDKEVIWRPDTFYPSSREVIVFHEPDRHVNHLTRIFKDGEVLDSQRLALTLRCPMEMSDFPFGRMECFLDLASYGHSSRDIKYEWKKRNPIQIKKGLRAALIGHELLDLQADYCTSVTNTGTYSCLRAKFIFSREPERFLVHLHLPSCLLVVLSWISLWLERRSPSATLALLLDLLLIIAFLLQIQTIHSSIPVGAMAVECWMSVVLVFLVLATLEVGVVLVLGGWEKGPSLATKIDFFARILFPVAFTIFIIIYFAKYMG